MSQEDDKEIAEKLDRIETLIAKFSFVKKPKGEKNRRDEKSPEAVSH